MRVWVNVNIIFFISFSTIRLWTHCEELVCGCALCASVVEPTVKDFFFPFFLVSSVFLLLLLSHWTNAVNRIAFATLKIQFIRNVKGRTFIWISEYAPSASGPEETRPNVGMHRLCWFWHIKSTKLSPKRNPHHPLPSDFAVFPSLLLFWSELVLCAQCELCQETYNINEWISELDGEENKRLEKKKWNQHDSKSCGLGKKIQNICTSLHQNEYIGQFIGTKPTSKSTVLPFNYTKQRGKWHETHKY